MNIENMQEMIDLINHLKATSLSIKKEKDTITFGVTTEYGSVFRIFEDINSGIIAESVILVNSFSLIKEDCGEIIASLVKEKEDHNVEIIFSQEKGEIMAQVISDLEIGNYPLQSSLVELPPFDQYEGEWIIFSTKEMEPWKRALDFSQKSSEYAFAYLEDFGERQVPYGDGQLRPSIHNCLTINPLLIIN